MRGRSATGRLSTQKNPKSSKQLIAWDLPAPDMTVTIQNRSRSLELRLFFTVFRLLFRALRHHREQLLIKIFRRELSSVLESLIQRGYFDQYREISTWTDRHDNFRHL